MGGNSSKSPPVTPAPSPELKCPWRSVNWSTKQEILKHLNVLKPSVEPLRILLYGPAGAGKSCFINSVQRALLGCNASSSLESSAGAGESSTLSIKSYKLKKRGGGHYPFVFSDIIVLDPSKGGIHTEDIIKVLEGRILEGYKFDAASPITEDDPKYNHCPNLCDKVHCLVYVLPSDSTAPNVIEKIRKIQEKASKSIPKVIVLTKVDKVSEMVNRDLRKVYHSKKIEEKVEDCSDKLTILSDNIHPVKNYHAEVNEDANVDVLILMALRNIVKLANNYAK
ncbi:interferon-induced protein 44-like [Colossoma macropomum]|uniref:interferon-induced protein 44-like n=1 Tax=Colossoma macropomum TaxID=42526 RepID=UPI001863F5A3|nr:interferon-induced protein 44-like [Colossoma macropomum]XP_036418091.1 interferon-induced protein 44-like [Colossoma macropomum]XP_036418092.1 interferon-induced protein 44-like [Colossoma macropomum]